MDYFRYYLSPYIPCLRARFNKEGVDLVLKEIETLIQIRKEEILGVHFYNYDSPIPLTQIECDYICSQLRKKGCRVNTLLYYLRNNKKYNYYYRYYLFDIDWTDLSQNRFN